VSGEFSVDVDALRLGGVDIDAISRTSHSILRELYSAVTLYANAGGDGEIGKAMKLNYEPTRDDGLQFLELLGQSLSLNGDRTVKLGDLMGDVDSDATVISHGPKAH
jgi:hypothetical protein